MRRSKGNVSILHVILAIRETSAPYNEHCLPWAEKRDITICTFFRSDIKTPEAMTLYEGDGTLTGFFHNLKAALTEKQYDVIHVHSPHLGLLFLLTTVFAYRRFRKSALITVHDSFPNFKFRNRLMFIPIFASFRRVVCCSRASYDSFPTLFKKLAGDRLSYVQNGLDVARVDRIAAGTRQRSDKNAAFTIVSISRLVNIKNPFSVLGAFQQSNYQTSRLVVIGDGFLRDSLIKKSRQAGLAKQVEFTGLIPREKVFEYLLNADLFISASRGEGLPISVLEAMACGCPVVLSDIPPHREIAEGVDFIPLIQPDDLAGFTREIEKFQAMSEVKRSMMGQECRKLVEKQFSLPAMHAGYNEIYAQITGAQGSSLVETIV